MRNRRIVVLLVLLSSIAFFLVRKIAADSRETEKKQVKIPKTEQVKVDKIYPYDQTLFTQGLEVVEDQIVVGTGQYDKSEIGNLSLRTGELSDVMKLDDQYFGEGLSYDGKHIWQLTWKEGVVLVRDPETFGLEESHYYDGEGWGLCYDGKHFIMSDGSDILTYRNNEDFSEIKEVKVTRNGNPVEKLNELEYVKGYVYANVWYSNSILKINAKSGQVEKVYDASKLLKESKLTEAEMDKVDVLNGIAHVEENTFLLAGKYWPRIFQVTMD